MCNGEAHGLLDGRMIPILCRRSNPVLACLSFAGARRLGLAATGIRNEAQVLKEVGTDYTLSDMSDEEYPREYPSKT